MTDKTRTPAPLISIIVPVYNVSRYLEKALNTIIQQSFENFECILVDDGSTDVSGEICDRYAEMDSRFRVIHQKNEGLPAARLTGYKHSKGVYIGFVDGDDWIEPDMYEKLVGAMRDGIDITMVCFIQECQGSSLLEVRKKWDKTVLEAEKAIIHFLTRRVFGWELWCKLYRRDLFDDSIFPIGISVGEDLVTSCRLFQKARKVVYLPYDSYHYRLHPCSMTHTGARDVSLKFIDALKMVLCDIRFCNGFVCNYLLCWYSYLIAGVLIGSYNEDDFSPHYTCDRLLSELRWSLSKVEDNWLDRMEKKLANIFLNVEPNVWLSEMRERNKRKCFSFSGNNEVYIYGAGKMGGVLQRELSKIGVKIKGFIVSEKPIDVYTVNGIRVYGLNEMMNVLANIYIFLGVSSRYLDEIKKILVKSGARHFFLPPILKYEQLDYAGIEKERDKLLLSTASGFK